VVSLFQDECIRTALFLTVLGIATVICLHDYPGKDHLDSFHDLIRDDLSIRVHEPLTQSTWIIGVEDTMRTGVNANYVSHIWPLAGNVGFIIGFFRLCSWLSPPDENAMRLHDLYDLISGLSPPVAASHQTIGCQSDASLFRFVSTLLVIFPFSYSLSLSYPSLHRSGNQISRQSGKFSVLECYKRRDKKSASLMLRQFI
jgi:hypothetical protein